MYLLMMNPGLTCPLRKIKYCPSDFHDVALKTIPEQIGHVYFAHFPFHSNLGSYGVTVVINISSIYMALLLLVSILLLSWLYVLGSSC